MAEVVELVLNVAPAPFFGSLRVSFSTILNATLPLLRMISSMALTLIRSQSKEFLIVMATWNLPSGAVVALTIDGVAFLLTGIGQVMPPAGTAP